MLMVRMIWQGSGQRVSSMLMVRMSWQGSWLLGFGQRVRFLREQVMLVGRVWVSVRWNMTNNLFVMFYRQGVVCALPIPLCFLSSATITAIRGKDLKR